MLKVLAGYENIDKLLQIDTLVRFNIFQFQFLFVLLKVDLSKLRYFYIDDMESYFVNKVDREQRAAHRRVSFFMKIKFNI